MSILRHVLLGVLLALLLISVPASADGVIVPIAPPDPPQPVQYLAVKYHHVTIDVSDQILHCEIDQVFQPILRHRAMLFPCLPAWSLS